MKTTPQPNNHNLAHLQAVPSLPQPGPKGCVPPPSHPIPGQHSSAKHNAWTCLGKAWSVQQQAVKAATAKARQAAASEVAEWLHTTGIRTMQSATPENMLVYLTHHWLPNHAGLATSAGELIAAPSRLSGIKSHLAEEFELLGRSGDWTSATQTGNPKHSIQIKTMLTGYSDHAAELGYQKKGAVPLSAAEVEMLLCSLLDKHHSMTGST